MREGGGGSIVMISTLSIRQVLHGHGPYAASKSALLTASQTLALELGGGQPSASTPSVPGGIMGEGLRVWFHQLAEERRRRLSDNPRRAWPPSPALNRIATSAEIAEAVAFFASDRASAITGQSLDVNCGSFFV